MKKLSVFVLLSFTFLFTSCEKLDRDPDLAENIQGFYVANEISSGSSTISLPNPDLLINVTAAITRDAKNSVSIETRFTDTGRTNTANFTATNLTETGGKIYINQDGDNFAYVDGNNLILSQRSNGITTRVNLLKR